MWVQDENSYDRFFFFFENIYLTTAHFNIEGNKMHAPVSSGAFATTAKENFPVVEDYCRIAQWGTGFVRYEDVKSSSIYCYYSDPNFFDFFNFPIVKGNSVNPLQNPNDVVITEHLAMQLFGQEEAVGKVASLSNGQTVHVTAVMKDMPRNTYIPHVDLVSKYDIDTASYYNRILETWYGCEFFSFMRIKSGTDVAQLAEQVTDKQTELREIRAVTIQPLVNMHLYDLEGEPEGLKTVRLFQWIAIVILVIACINYVNLVTARASKRHREIGLKKILGARKPGLFLQLIGEAIILFIYAIAVAIVLNLSFLPSYNSISGKDMVFSLLDIKIWMIYFGMLVIVVGLAGIYPAYMIASYKTNVLQSVKTKLGNTFLRKILVVLQFTATTTLIIGTIVLGAQMKYIREKDMGYNREQVLMCGLYDMRDHFYAVKAELEQQSSILGVTASSENIMAVSSGHGFETWEGKIGEGMSMHTQLRADTSFLRVMGLTLKEGAGFTSVSERQYILNEAAVKTMGLTDPVGKWVDDPSHKIVGVVKDFHFASLHQKIEPLVIYYEPWLFFIMSIRTAPGKAQDAIAALEKVWKQYNPDVTFDYAFLDETFDRIYKSDIVTSQLFGIFSVIAILISCLGLFGLVVFTARQKTKEIGIRKVLGASIKDIISLLTREFLILVGIAILIAFPLAYFWLERLLQDYAYRIDISAWIFVFAGIITIVLTIITVSWQAIKAAIANPVDAIQSN
jgi:hypothetical protein